jgi:transposase
MPSCDSSDMDLVGSGAASSSSTEHDPEVIPGNSEFGNRYNRAYKLKVLRESDACTKSGDLGLYLRRMGLTHASLTGFRKQRAAGTLDSPQPAGKKRAEKSQASPDQVRRLMDLERENRKLRRHLEQAEAIIEIQKKVSRLLEISMEDPEILVTRKSS